MSNATARRTAWIGFCLLVALGGGNHSFAGKQFRWKLAKGDAFDVEMIQAMRQTTTSGTQTVEVPTRMVMTMTWKVDDVDAQGKIELTQTIQRIRMSTEVPNVGTVKFDSNTVQEPEGLAKIISDMMKPMVGAHFIQEMDSRGAILDLRVPKQAFQGFAANPMMQQFFSDESFKKMMTQASPVLPEDAIDAGYGWQTTSQNKSPLGIMTMTATYTYLGEEERDSESLDRFAAKVDVSLDQADARSGAEARIVSQENTGTLYFDADAGHFVETSMAQKLALEISAGTQSINQRLESTVKMTVRKR